jgi:peptidoglycan/LPS O-acetylase OafA/YrhL
MKKLPELDGIRGLAILMVLIWHYFNCANPDLAVGSMVAYAYKMSAWFWSGVDLFFVLSGFLIGGIIIDNREAKNFLQVFYLRRALRILPVYGLVLGAYFVLRAVLENRHFTWLFDGPPAWSYLSFTQNLFMGLGESFGGLFLSPTWSLAVEEQFYLALPLLLFVVPRKQWTFLFVMLTLLAPTLRILFPGTHAFVNTPFRMDSLFLGVIAAVVVRNARARTFLTTWKWLLRLVFLVLLIWIGMMVQRGQIALGIPDHLLLGCCYTALLLIAVIESGSPIVGFLRVPFLRFFGLISYGLYMYHQAVLGLLHAIILGREPSLKTPAGWMVTLTALVISVGLAVLSYYLFEQHLLRLGRSHTYINPSATRPSPAPSAPDLPPVFGSPASPTPS